MEGKKKDKRDKRVSLLVPMLIIFCLMFCMILYTSHVIQNVAVTNIHEVGEDRISGVAAQLENYLDMTKSVLWVTADTVDHMARKGSTAQEILEYITEESDSQEQHFDENFTGIYGYVLGEYLDGVGWTPPEGYDPLQRDWYLAAKEADGDSTIVSPYVDAQTNAVIISISRMLSNGTDVLSLDVRMNHIQDIMSNLQIKGKGYGFIVNRDGMVIAHHNEARRGQFLNKTEEEHELMAKTLEVQNGNFQITMGGEKNTVFVHEIMDQWYVVLVVSNGELFAEVWQQLAFNVLISIIIFALIAFFYLLGRRNEQNYSSRIEEMRAEEQRQAYEAKALKLEKEAADQANRAKSGFLAEMSHEIRTPINAVLGMNEMILRDSLRARDSGELDKEEERTIFNNILSYASNIESAGSNLLSILNDILDFSKIESGRMDIVEGEYKLSSVLNDISNMIFFRAKDKDLDYIVDVDATIPDSLYGDEVRVRQVIINVLNNAVKYTEKGSVRLQVRKDAEACPEHDGSVCLVISVTDTGIGIKPEDMEKLFTKFQRVDLNRNSTVEGTGLGLAITQRLLEMMGGSIRVESEYGVGSTFTITLPQRIVAGEPLGDFETKLEKNMLKAKPYEEFFRAPEARILVVDDTRMNLNVVIGLLKNTEIRIDTASGGEDAIQLARDHAYDLILMDQRMPIMDGTEAMHAIQNQENGLNRDVPVICLTADAILGAKERYLTEGFTDYLSKPIDSAALEKMLITYLPSDKVELRKRTSTSSAREKGRTSDNEFEFLRDSGVDPEEGLRYCQGDTALYRSLLEDYLRNATQKIGEIQRNRYTEDWKNYSILVHALKSTSRMIGANELADLAAGLEEAADRGDADAIRPAHPGMIKRYLDLMDVLAVHIDIDEPAGEDARADGVDEVLEFFPE